MKERGVLYMLMREKSESEPLYRDIIQNIRNSGILQGVSYDPVQAELIGNRIKDNLKKMCKNDTQ